MQTLKKCDQKFNTSSCISMYFSAIKIGESILDLLITSHGHRFGTTALSLHSSTCALHLIRDVEAAISSTAFASTYEKRENDR